MLDKILYSILISKGKRVRKRLNELTKDPMKHNLELLFGVLSENKDTEYGRKCKFSEIHTLEDYKANVPFTNYDSYAPYIDKMKKGETNLITKDAPVYFAATSGSVANPKAIPVLAKTREIYKDYGTAYGFAVIDEHLNQHWKKDKALNLMEVRASTMPCGTPYGSVSGMGVSSLKSLLPLIFTTPEACTFPTGKVNAVYVHLLFALKYRQLNGIVSAFMTMVADLIRYFEANWEMLVYDIEKGTINADIEMPDNIRVELLKLLKPDPQRADELRREFARGFDKETIKRIWPRLSFVYAIGSGGFAPYTKFVKEYIEDTSIYFSFYAASEAMIAVCTEMNSTKYTLLPESVFYEFIPLENSGMDNPETLTMEQLKQGEKYEIVLTTLSGFYRYRIQDVIEVVGMNNNTPEIRFVFRLNQMVSLAGEKTNEEHFRWSMQQCADIFDCHIPEYSVLPQETPVPGRYVVVLETNAPEKIKPRMTEVSQVIGKKLGEANPSFGNKVSAGLLAPVEAKLVQQETYALYRDLMEMRGISPNQIKPIRIIDTPEKERFFLGLLYKE